MYISASVDGSVMITGTFIIIEFSNTVSPEQILPEAIGTIDAKAWEK